jgi:hypothetical protein
MRWAGFATACPDLATLVDARLRRDQVLLLGTLRRDGSPRISAVECDFTEGELCVGMIWQSVKARDLLRDPRVTAHTWIPGKDNHEGDLKLYGTATEIADPRLKQAYEDAIFARLQWRPSEPYHAFAIDIEAAGLVRFRDGGQDVWRWRDGSELAKQFVKVS